jgi:hypothetical protein
LRRPVAAALFASTLRDLAPMIEAPSGALGFELHDAEFRVGGNERSDTELRGFLHDEIHGIGLGQCLHQRQIERGLRQRRVRCAERKRCAAPLHGLDVRLPLGAPTIEDAQLRPALQAQHMSQIVCFALVEREAIAVERSLDVEARQTVRRSCHSISTRYERFAVGCYIVGRMPAAHFSKLLELA